MGDVVSRQLWSFNTRSHDTDVSLNNGAADVWVVKINPDGELLWEKTFGGSSFDSAQAIHKTQNNDIRQKRNKTCPIKRTCITDQ